MSKAEPHHLHLRAGSTLRSWRARFVFSAEGQGLHALPEFRRSLGASRCHGQRPAGLFQAFAVRWKQEMERLGVQPYFTTYAYLVSLAAEVLVSDHLSAREDADRPMGP